MNIFKLTTLTIALLFTTAANADYMVKIPLEVSNGGHLPNGSIRFKNNAVEPVEPVVEDCINNGISEYCDERLGAWEKFVKDNGIGVIWPRFASMNAANRNLTEIPSIPYPLMNLEGSLMFDNNNLTNVDGLSSIKSIGSRFILNNNPNLTSLKGLRNLTIVYAGLEISDNLKLTNLDGLESLESVRYAYLYGNSLTNVNGLEKLNMVTNLLKLNDNELEDINGLRNLTYVGALHLQNNKIEDISPLKNLSSYSDINIDPTYAGPKLAMDTIFCKNGKSKFKYPYARLNDLCY